MLFRSGALGVVTSPVLGLTVSIDFLLCNVSLISSTKPLSPVFALMAVSGFLNIQPHQFTMIGCMKAEYFRLAKDVTAIYALFW